MAELGNVNHFDRYVQGGMVDGQYLNAAYTLLAAGPPRLAQLNSAIAGGTFTPGGQVAFPIGIVQNLNLSQNRTFNRIWEIGSERSYFIPGRTVQQLGLGRVYFHGPSLLRVLYAYYKDLADGTVGSLFQNLGEDNVPNPHDVIIPPGLENFFLNLASDLFAQPLGLLLILRDSNSENMGAQYLEQAYIPNHTIATDAQGTIVQESVAIQFERMIPVNVNAIRVVNTFDDIQSGNTPFRTGTGTGSGIGVSGLSDTGGSAAGGVGPDTQP